MTKQLYKFQSQTVKDLLSYPDKHIVVAEVGLGKGAISVSWAYEICRRTGKRKVLVITTSSKVHVKDDLKRNDFEQDADEFVSSKFRSGLEAFETVSWDSLYKWVEANRRSLSEWVVIADEIFRAKNPLSRRGKSFQKIVQATPYWTGYTATPGSVWLDYLGYFEAAGLVRNKTRFMQRFCVVQTYKGFPEIVSYREEDTLKAWWAKISYAPDARRALSELPKANYSIVTVSKPKGYDKVLKMRQKLCADGTPSKEYEDIIENPSQLTNYLRRLCFTPQKKQWITDFLEGLGDNAILFYNYKDTGDELEEIAKNALPKDAKIWRIDGAHHQIPTKETIGKYDVVLTQWQSGSEGLNLQFLNQWIAVEMTYSQVIWHQAKGRVMRIGQTRPVFYYLLKTEHTIEDAILKCIRQKQDFAERVWLLGNGLLTEKEKQDVNS